MRVYVNVDHVATVREARRTDEPDPGRAAELCELAGAHGITVHLREDRRHIQNHDVLSIAQATRGCLNLELATAPDVVDFCIDLKPDQATLVPEKREEITTEGGIDLFPSDDSRLVTTIERIRAAGVRISLFVDPELRVLERASELGVPAVELHTGDYANSYRESDTALVRLRETALRARELGLAVHAGHGLTYLNVQPVAAIKEIEELNIGHSIVSRAVLTGMTEAVTEMIRLINEVR